MCFNVTRTCGVYMWTRMSQSRSLTWDSLRVPSISWAVHCRWNIPPLIDYGPTVESSLQLSERAIRDADTRVSKSSEELWTPVSIAVQLPELWYRENHVSGQLYARKRADAAKGDREAGLHQGTDIGIRQDSRGIRPSALWRSDTRHSAKVISFFSSMSSRMHIACFLYIFTVY